MGKKRDQKCALRHADRDVIPQRDPMVAERNARPARYNVRNRGKQRR